MLATQETLRFHPIAFHLQRVAGKDDVIPLSDPVIGKNGETITELPISAGQPILLSICGYNRYVVFSSRSLLMIETIGLGFPTYGEKTRILGTRSVS